MTSTSLLPPSVDDAVKEWADARLVEIETRLDAGALTILSPILWGLEHQVRLAVETRERRRDALLVILDTGGGVVEVVERIV